MFSNSDVRQKSRCYRCSHEFVKVEGENVCSRCGSELFPSLAQLQTPVNAGSVNGSCSTGQTLQPLSNLIDPTLPLPSFTSNVLPPFRALPPLSIPPNNTSTFLPNSANSLPFPQLPPPPLAQINELNGFPKQSLPMNNNVNMNLNLNNSLISMSNGHRPVNINIQNNNNENMNNHPQNVNNNPNFQSESNANKAANGNTPSNNTVRRVNITSGNETTVVNQANNVESNNYNINNNNINTSNNAQTPNNNPNTTSSSNNNANILPNHQRILQTVHLQHIQNLIEIQRTMHLQNPPYPHSHSPDIARIVNEINTVMHNHSLQHFQALSSALQNNRSIQNAHHETLFPSNFNGSNNEMSSQEYSQILADLFERQQGHSGPPPTDKNELSKLPQLIFSEEDLKDEKQCAVCKELFQEDDTAVELPCSHPFHLDCILPWLTTRNTCPCCRYQLKPAEETNNRNDDNDNMSDSDDGEGDGDYEIADSESDFSSDDGDDSNTFTTSYVYNN